MRGCRVRRSRELSPRERDRTNHDRKVRDVEDTSSNGTCANVEKVDDSALSDTIDPVRRATCDEQGKTQRRPSAHPAPDRDDDQSQKHRAGCNRENGRSRGRCQFRSDAQETTLILDVSNPDGVSKVRAVGRARERGLGNVFGDLVAADRPDNRYEQHDPAGPSPGEVHVRRMPHLNIALCTNMRFGFNRYGSDQRSTCSAISALIVVVSVISA
jgi:hypothetical protein